MSGSRAAGSAPRYVSAFFFLSSAAEAAQAVTLLWLAFDLTHSGAIVGVVIALGYLPATVAGPRFQAHADRGRADRLTHRTNVVLAAVSLLLLAELLMAPDVEWLAIAAIMASQIVLALVKMVNKAAVGRVLRDSFTRETCARVLQVSSSVSLIGTLSGALVAGALIETGTVTLGLLVAALGYVLSVLAMRRGTVDYAPEPRPEGAPHPALRTARALAKDARLRTVLVFSVPSSGALPYLSTLLVPLADRVAPERPGFYALLVAASTIGGVAAGAVLAAGRLTSARALDLALPATIALAVMLALATGEVPVLGLVLAVTFTITAHIVCMQVMTNQLPEPDEVGQFAVMRNTVATLAKGGFSLLAGVLISAFGTGGSAAVLALVLLPFAAAWPALRHGARPRGEVVAS